MELHIKTDVVGPNKVDWNRRERRNSTDALTICHLWFRGYNTYSC